MTQTLTPPREAAAQEAAMDEVRQSDPLAQRIVTIEGEDDQVREFAVKRLKARRFLMLIDLLVDKFEVIAGSGLLDSRWMDAASNPALIKEMLPSVRKVWKEAPDLIEQLLGIMLGSGNPHQSAWILDNIELEQIPDVIEAFMAVNPWGDIADRFFRLGRSIMGKLPNNA